MHVIVRFVALALLIAVLPLAAQTVQDTAFTYQGELRQNNQPVTGSVDMVFTLYDAATGGNPVGLPIAMTTANADPVQVTNGLFTVTLDFGNVFFDVADDARWLAVSVANNALSPRTKIANSPYSLTSQLAYNVPANSIGTTQIVPSQVQQRVTGNCGTGSSISVINQDGTVNCQSAGSGTITGVTPVSGSGLTGGATTGSVSIGTDFNVLQKRVSGTCASGSSISTVNADGTVACLAGSTGTVTSVTAGNGLLGGTITSTGTIDVDTSVVALKTNTWSLNGNAGVGTSFLGTTDNTTLLLKVNGMTAGQLQPTAPASPFYDSPNVIFGSSANNVLAGVVGATVGGGGSRSTSGTFNNAVSSSWGTVSGGSSNGVGGFGAFVGGGNANSANGQYSVVDGGQVNNASGDGAVVPGGYANKAGGIASFAGGAYAHVRSAADTGSSGDSGTFIWSDYSGSSTNQFISSGVNQFLVRAGGGVGINTVPYNPEAELTIQGSATAGSSNADIVLLPRSSGYGFNLSVSGTVQSDAAFAIETTANNFAKVFAIDASGNVTVSQGNLTLAGAAAQAYKPGGGTWAAPSDARLKRDVQPLEHVLDRLLQLRGVTFEYANPDQGLHPPGRHTGFIAQEVQEVFPEWVGNTPDGYLTVGPKGFEAMTVEALRELREEKDAEIAALRTELAELSERVDQLQARPVAQP